MNDRKQHWDTTWSDKDQEDVGWSQRKPLVALKLMGQENINKDASLIDIGGGCSPFARAMIELGHDEISILDISCNAIEKHKRILGDAASKAHWICGDILEEKLPSVDVWHDRAVLHFLTEKVDQQAYVSQMKRALTKSGLALIATFAMDGPSKCTGLPIHRYDSEGMKAILGDDFLLDRVVPEIHTTPMGVDQKFNWFVLRRI